MYNITPSSGIKAELNIPADKSISHRAVFLSALCPQKTKIYPFLSSDDTEATLDCMKRLGVSCYRDSSSQDNLYVQGKSLYFPKEGEAKLFAGESGTTIRILTGLLVGQKFSSHFSASTYLSRRPMSRIINPLSEMKANISGNRKTIQGKENIYPPLMIEPVPQLVGKEHKNKIASAQVKSALLLAGLYAKGQTIVEEPHKSRDHTEKMLKNFGADIKINNTTITLTPGNKLRPPKEIFIPSDFSSAAFFIVLGLILKNSQITIKNVNLNSTRCGLLKVLKRMNADITIKNQKNAVEPYGDLVVKSSKLKPTIVEPEEIPAMIDEVPILCVAAAFANGRTQIKGVKELTVKETDRVNSMLVNLGKAGVGIAKKYYGQDDLKIEINGSRNYKGGEFESYGDHRTAMSMVIFALTAKGPSSIDDLRCINKSFPEFMKIVEKIKKDED
ncbi:MAG: 3-phosphoshikimate 1-carboxyvinyltransferase [Candidatus Omnitrophica bacterium]|nr:3-phosphoshikimate 1-carboxyvinyltransferase [Candidatus Omnitrophota bacterium]MCF7894049.1 3-phosphoshikimate 1-carboxyvinyltransferase [Candidatus Omnitrophota bacterium]